jgi:hypothetical protein
MQINNLSFSISISIIQNLNKYYYFLCPQMRNSSSLYLNIMLLVTFVWWEQWMTFTWISSVKQKIISGLNM